MINPLTKIKSQIYDKQALQIVNYQTEKESQEYGACRFELDGLNIISRNAKITPKKTGQFVTFWKRKGNGPIEPFHETDAIDLYVVNIINDQGTGQFVIPKPVLIKKGIISTDSKEGKRAFRVYAPWDTPNNKQAERNQKWQLKYFYKLDGSTEELQRAKELYTNIQIDA